MTFNAIEFIAFRGDEFSIIKDRCRQLCEIAQAIIQQIGRDTVGMVVDAAYFYIGGGLSCA